MDDVLEGGFTVLPDVNVRVPSVKGSALVVYNTRSLCTPFGVLYNNTQYGSCPIFYGDKWSEYNRIVIFTILHSDRVYRY